LRRHRVGLSAVALVAAIGVAPAYAQQPVTWQKMPRMHLDRQFAGPLNDTIIQRWRDPVDGMICYIYLPISVQHTTPAPSTFVQYGANTIGSISCMMPPPAGRAAPAAQAAVPIAPPVGSFQR
jgi:hypothetical protein